MLRKLSFFVPICASFLPGCMSAPPLSQATGAEHSEIMIKDVVQRVKCELSDAFDEKTAQPQFIWLANWTAHVDLALAVNDNAGISPNGSYTKFHQSAVNSDAGPATQGGHTFPLVSQFFTVAVGANLSGQAVRTETVSFTLPLDELKMWRQERDRIEAGWPPEKRSCNFPSSTGVTGNLGLKEWVDSAFYPVEKDHQLTAGIHNALWKDFPIPNVNGPFNYDAYLRGQLERNRPRLGAPAREAEARALRAGPTVYEDVLRWQGELKNLQTAINSYTSTISSANEKIRTSISSIGLRLHDNRIYLAVMSRHVDQKYNGVVNKLIEVSKTVETCGNYKKNVDMAYAYSYALLPSLYQLNSNSGAASGGDSNPGGGSSKAASNKCISEDEKSKYPGLKCPAFDQNKYNSLEAIMKDIEDRASKPNDPKKPTYEQGALDCANKLTPLADFVSTFVNDIPTQVDPPVDSVLHSLQFVVSYGANVTPSWTLLQWKGPGQAGNFASASSARTHNLQLALGPRSGAASISQDATRLIQNQTVRSLGN